MSLVAHLILDVFHLNKPMRKCVNRECRNALDAELVCDVFAVCYDGGKAYAKSVGSVFVDQAACEELEHLNFALR